MADDLFSTEEISQLLAKIPSVSSDDATVLDAEPLPLERPELFDSKLIKKIKTIFNKACKQITFRISDGMEIPFNVKCDKVEELPYESAIRCIRVNSLNFVLFSDFDSSRCVFSIDMQTVLNLICILKDQPQMIVRSDYSPEKKDMTLLSLYIDRFIEEFSRAFKEKYSFIFSIERIERTSVRLRLGADADRILMASFTMKYQIEGKDTSATLNFLISESFAKKL